MAYIGEQDPRQATGEVKAFYDLFADVPGGVPDIVRVLSLKPDAMRATRSLYRAVMFADSGLKRADREMVAVVVSMINGCTYCAERHVATLLELNKDADLVSQIQSDFHVAPVDPRTLAMLRFAEKLTRFPESGYREDVASLRQHGLSDGEILDLALVVAYFNFIARIATGLGVET